jgi:hypothetical protein
VGEEEVAGRGGEAPSATDGAAAEDGFGGQAEEDLPYQDLIREAPIEKLRSWSCGLPHGRWLGDHLICPRSKAVGVVVVPSCRRVVTADGRR